MKKASYKRCFLYVIIIPKGDIMNTKYNIIITSITIILLIILKIINCKKYKNNQDSILLKNEKRNTKIFFIISILLFIFSLIFNKYINDYVQSIASIVENPEYYGIIDKNSIEYRNYLTMVDMVNEHYQKYGEKLNEASSRVGFSGEEGGLKNSRDIKSKDLKYAVI